MGTRIECEMKDIHNFWPDLFYCLWFPGQPNLFTDNVELFLLIENFKLIRKKEYISFE